MGESVRQVNTGKIYNACGKFNLNESADIVRQSKLVISHDTGMQYIAAALQKQVIAIWGGTSPKLDVSPYYGSAGKNGEGEMYDNILLDIRCQPCSRYGTDVCPLEHFDCMEKLSMVKIAERVMKRLGR
jgi:ADP-heptose:LPS heptosyltransferase